MDMKLFEIRDRSTLIPAMGVLLKSDTLAADAWLLRHAGYGDADIAAGSLVLLVTLADGNGRAVCDPYDWGCHTLTPVHHFITEHWAELSTGAVVDAEFIRGEMTAPCETARHGEPWG